ncbi:MAG: transcriptional activator NhaR [Burkholderiaceae bacterium]|nr:transcriptional activator NhaR [Burkholderiaceae bacterium]
MNFKHLHYFWVAAKTGGIVRAGKQLHITPQTLSGQIKLLEEQLGRPLFRKSGRRLELTASGQLALRYAEDIFTLGAELEAALQHDQPALPAAPLRIGITDAVPKAIAYRLIEPALQGVESPRLICEEGEMDDLLADLAVHRLDLVIADAPLPAHVNVRAFNHRLGRTTLSFFAAPQLRARVAQPFPQCLAELPLLLPATSSAARGQIDQWLGSHKIAAHIAGEFEDGALMTAFGREGRGAFAAPSVLMADLERELGVGLLGHCDDTHQEFYAISVERRITHPGVAQITRVAKDLLAE